MISESCDRVSQDTFRMYSKCQTTAVSSYKGKTLLISDVILLSLIVATLNLGYISECLELQL